MKNSFIIQSLYEDNTFNSIAEGLHKRRICIAVSGLSDAQKMHYACALAERTKRTLVVIAESERTASMLAADCSALLNKTVKIFPARELSFYQNVASSHEVSFRRIEALNSLITGEAGGIVAPVDALLHRLVPKKLFEECVIQLSVGQTVSPEWLTERLLAIGYTREYMVEGKGQFSVRGEIVDIYPSDAVSAIRLDFFDEEIDSIRTFDVLSQRSADELERITIPPANEAPLPEGYCADRFVQSIANALATEKPDQTDKSNNLQDDSPTLANLPDDQEEEAKGTIIKQSTFERFKERLNDAMGQTEKGISSAYLERFIDWVYDATESLFDYADHPIVILNEPHALLERLENRLSEYGNAFVSAVERGDAFRQQKNLLLQKEEALAEIKAESVLCMTSIQRELDDWQPALSVDIGGRSIGSYSGRTKEMCRDIRKWMENQWRVIVLSGGTARGQRIQQSFEEEDILADFDDSGESVPSAGECVIYPLALSGGFQYPSIRVAVIVESDIYGNKGREKSNSKKAKGKLQAFTDLQVGDYVVHETHGIGIYEGIKRLTSEGASRDYLMIQYLGQDKLYIPVDHFDRIQKYIGSGEGSAPKLSHLGGKDWDKQKSKVRESLKALAFDLVKLYAERQKTKGHAFAKDSAWQIEFEENFAFEETEDQLQAIDEIKHDMEQEKPMDRLLCGDVGYGKTEVALRAAFKAVMDGKQVAILAPTTILVQQHYNTLIRRLEGFPVHADVLSRFRTAKEQKETLTRLKNGEIDIIVGTHRLLAKDVQFKNLGLLIVDEEQRFGVGHKETIANLKKTVDILTLSATPIPRTLHMSMVGIRDMSLLETPPQERYPVQTYVMEYQDSVIRDAILREIHRGGQVYFLYNRVGSIERCYSQLTKLVPEARIAIAHGQMKENVLEDVMMDFSQNKFDVLLCTTIIESGLDIPSANTLIIYDADRFGLSQLYQMRGRVGRSNRLAYAYFTVRTGKVLSETAQKRLDTIREFTEFGSGFRIAMRDLELRGAGNILGPQQSGHLANIGYDLYCKLLNEAVLDAKGETINANHDLDTRMDVHVNAYLPADYVTGDKQRLEVYKRIASVTSMAMRDEIEEELVDRFGEEPTCVANLVNVAYLKAICIRFGIDRVVQKPGAMELHFSSKAKLDGELLFKSVMGLDRRFVLKTRPLPMMVLYDQSKTGEELLASSLRIMGRLQQRMGIAEN